MRTGFVIRTEQQTLCLFVTTQCAVFQLPSDVLLHYAESVEQQRHICGFCVVNPANLDWLILNYVSSNAGGISIKAHLIYAVIFGTRDFPAVWEYNRISNRPAENPNPHESRREKMCNCKSGAISIQASNSPWVGNYHSSHWRLARPVRASSWSQYQALQQAQFPSYASVWRKIPTTRCRWHTVRYCDWLTVCLGIKARFYFSYSLWNWKLPSEELEVLWTTITRRQLH